jgi:hypothetical protein
MWLTTGLPFSLSKDNGSVMIRCTASSSSSLLLDRSSVTKLWQCCNCCMSPRLSSLFPATTLAVESESITQKQATCSSGSATAAQYSWQAGSSLLQALVRMVWWTSFTLLSMLLGKFGVDWSLAALQLIDNPLCCCPLVPCRPQNAWPMMSQLC